MMIDARINMTKKTVFRNCFLVPDADAVESIDHKDVVVDGSRMDDDEMQREPEDDEDAGKNRT